MSDCANKVSQSVSQTLFLKVCGCCLPKIIKNSLYACWNHSLSKLARFL